MPYKDHSRQLAAQREHYRLHKSDYARRSSQTRDAWRNAVDDLKRAPCTDCGGTYHPCVMQFDHVGTDKVAGIAVLLRKSTLRAVLAEILKCELVCANCHALRTWERLVGAAGETRTRKISPV